MSTNSNISPTAAEIDPSLGYCTGDQAIAHKNAGTVHSCAYNHPTLGEGYCGNSTRAMCEIAAGVGSGAGNDGYQLLDVNGVSAGHVNSYPGMNCLNAHEYGTVDHGALQYDVNYDREARFYLARVTTTCDDADCTSGTSDLTNIDTSNSGSANYQDPSNTAQLQAKLIAENAVELYNDADGGNFVTYFGADAGGSGATKSPAISLTFLEDTGKVTFGTDAYRAANPDFKPTVSMIDNTITFENLNACAMQPYAVAGLVYPYSESVPSSVPDNSSGTQVTVSNVVATDDQGVSTVIAAGVLPTGTSFGYETFGSQTADWNEGTSSLEQGSSDPVYSSVQISKTGPSPVHPTAAVGQDPLKFGASGTFNTTASTYSADGTALDNAPSAYQYDGCQKCSAYFYKDPSSGLVYYPAFNTDCATEIAAMGASTTKAVQDAAGNTVNIEVCTSGCPAGVTVSAFTGATSSVTQVATDMVDNLTGLQCDMSEMVNTNNYYGQAIGNVN